MSSSVAPTINTQAAPSSSPPLTASSPTASSSPTSLLSPQGRISLRATSALSRDRYSQVSQVSEQREEERRKREEREKRDGEDRDRRDRDKDGSREKERDNRGSGRERHDRSDRGERTDRTDRPRRDDGRHGRGGDRDRKDRHDNSSDDRRDRDRQHDGRDNRERDRGERSGYSSSNSFSARRTTPNHSNNMLRITPSSLNPSSSSSNSGNSPAANTIASSPIDLSPSPLPATTLVNINSTTPHPLAHSWCLYFDRRTSKNKQLPTTQPATSATASTTASTSYENSLQLVSTFDTAEALLSLLHYLLLPSSLDCNSNYHLFRHGVRPIWEDESNEQGGKWVAKAAPASVGRVDSWWVRLLLRVVGETLGDEEDGGTGSIVDDVNGCVFSRRRQGDRIAVWNRSREEGRIKALGGAIKQALTSGGGGGQVHLAYDLHEDSMKAGSSYSNASRYTM